MCKELVYISRWNDDCTPQSTRKLLGIVIEENSNYIIFQTEFKRYRVQQRAILSLADTDIVYRGGNQDE